MKILLLTSVSFLFALNSPLVSAQELPGPIVAATAQMQMCNDVSFDCDQAIPHDKGYGLIWFRDLNHAPVAVVPGGADPIQKAMVTGHMQAFLVLQCREPANLHRKYFYSSEVTVSGHFSVDESTGATLFEIDELR